MRRLPAAALLLAAFALLAAGCGSTKSASSNGLDTALSYVPKGAPLVVAVDTDPNGAQWQQVDHLIGKFPGGGQVKEQFKSAFGARSGVDWDRDVKPLLGNDLVVALTAVPQHATPAPYVLAWKVKDENALRRLLQRHPTAGTSTTVRSGTLIAARSKPDLNAAVTRAQSGDHMSEQDFTDALGPTNGEGLVRVAGNLQALIAGSRGTKAVPWVAALRTFGAALKAEQDGIGWTFDVKTEAGTLTKGDLPLAAGEQSAPVVRRAGEVGFGLRDPAQAIEFGQAVARLANPAGYARFTAGHHLNLDRDVVGQLKGNAAVSISISGQYAVRADLRDPAAARATLRKLAPSIANRRGAKLVAPSNGNGLYDLTDASGKHAVFGVIGKQFVAASDAARAVEFAGESASTVPGAKGALTIASDARGVVDTAAAQRGQGVAAQLFTTALGDVIGSVEAETSGLSGAVKLHVK